MLPSQDSLESKDVDLNYFGRRCLLCLPVVEMIISTLHLTSRFVNWHFVATLEYPVSLIQFLPTVLVSTDSSFLNQPLIRWLANMLFSFYFLSRRVILKWSTDSSAQLPSQRTSGSVGRDLHFSQTEAEWEMETRETRYWCSVGSSQGCRYSV